MKEDIDLTTDELLGLAEAKLAAFDAAHDRIAESNAKAFKVLPSAGRPPPDEDEAANDSPFGQVADAKLMQIMSSQHLRTKEMPPEDFLFINAEGGGIFSTTDIVQVFGDTGTGKTLFALAAAVAVAAGTDFLHWDSNGARRVIYFDGELAEATMAERLSLACESLTPEQCALVDANLFVFNRDTAFNDCGIELSTLDSVAGRTQVEYLCDLIKPDLCVFDSRFCLLDADMKESESMPKPLNLAMRRRKCMGLWLHHTGKDTSRGGYGDKSAEWMLDANIELAAIADSPSLSLSFKKKRKRSDLNADLYADITISCQAGAWYRAGDAPPTQRKAPRTNTNETLALMAVRELTIAAKESGRNPATGHAGEPVVKISRERIREWAINHGHYEAVDGRMGKADRESMNKAIRNLIPAGSLAGDKESVWMIQ